MKDIEQQIQSKLDDLQQQKDCRLLLAVESGSRAWGYASANSDYDVRCIYYYPQERYLSVRPPRDTVEWELNEVFDITGKRCAPIESGLPFIFSTPNEQRYLDRDSFDPWNPMPSCDVEHYYPCNCMTGVYGEKKRIWEVLPLFGRKWYVWMTTRTMNDYAIENHEDIVRHADYLIT